MAGDWEFVADLTLDQAGDAEWSTPVDVPVSDSWNASVRTVSAGTAEGLVQSIAGEGLAFTQYPSKGYNVFSFPLSLLGDYAENYEVMASVVIGVPQAFGGASVHLATDPLPGFGARASVFAYRATSSGMPSADLRVSNGVTAVDVTSEMIDWGGDDAHLAIVLRRSATTAHASFKVYNDVNPPGPGDVEEHDLGDVAIEPDDMGDLCLLFHAGDPPVSYYNAPLTWKALRVRFYAKWVGEGDGPGPGGGGPGGGPGPVFTPPSLRRRFRDAVRELSPPWLRGGLGEEILGAIAVQLDDLTDRLVAGVRVRFPGLYGFESLALIGRERRIRRGRLETDAVYVARLGRWLDDHRRRGGAYALLGQLYAHYAPASFPIVLRYASGRRYQMDAAGVIVRDVDAWAVPGGATPRWSRWWLFYTWPDPISDDGAWSDPGTWGDGGVWGSDLTPDEVRDLRLVPREWGAAHATGRIVLESPTMTVSISVEGG